MGHAPSALHARLRFVELPPPRRPSFAHTVQRDERFLLPDVMGAGVAVLDADGDGALDLYFTDAGATEGEGAPNRFFRREEDGGYRDATAESGLGDRGYGFGVAVGDLENDGDPDVYVGNLGRDALYLNDGSARFEDATEAWSLEGAAWTTSVALLDHDLDGWLDVFAVRYVAFEGDRACTVAEEPDFCSPVNFPGLPDALLGNRAARGFEDRSETAGIHVHAAAGLGLVVEDFDEDGWPDVFVANDSEPNFLWINRDGRFEERASGSGVAVDQGGRPQGCMGVATGDVDGDGLLDLFTTNLDREHHALYQGAGELRFVDRSYTLGLGWSTKGDTGFGTLLLDADHDADLDLLVVNGRVARPDGTPPEEPWWAGYAERNRLYQNLGQGQFEPVEAPTEGFGSHFEVSRSLAAADLDGDGDLDLVLANVAGPARVYANASEPLGNWLQVRAFDPALQRDAFGARVHVLAGEAAQTRTIGTGVSYLTSSSPEAHFGLGDATAIDSFCVRWPGGGWERFPSPAVNARIEVRRGEGESIERPPVPR